MGAIAGGPIGQPAWAHHHATGDLTKLLEHCTHRIGRHRLVEVLNEHVGPRSFLLFQSLLLRDKHADVSLLTSTRIVLLTRDHHAIKLLDRFLGTFHVLEMHETVA